MNAYLNGPELPGDVRSFLQINGHHIDYGGDTEYFTAALHRVPVTTQLWIAGNTFSAEVILTRSAVEAAAFIDMSRNTFPNPFGLLFIALGNCPHPTQLEMIRQRYRKRKFTLVFGDDLLGRLADIRIATSLRNKMVSLRYLNNRISIGYRGRLFEFEPESLTLAKAERALGIRTGIKTRKPVGFVNFIDQRIQRAFENDG